MNERTGAGLTFIASLLEQKERYGDEPFDFTAAEIEAGIGGPMSAEQAAELRSALKQIEDVTKAGVKHSEEQIAAWLKKGRAWRYGPTVFSWGKRSGKWVPKDPAEFVRWALGQDNAPGFVAQAVSSWKITEVKKRVADDDELYGLMRYEVPPGEQLKAIGDNAPKAARRAWWPEKDGEWADAPVSKKIDNEQGANDDE